MNKVMSLLVVFVLLFGCVPLVQADEANLTVVATTYPLYDIARQIGGEHLNVLYDPDVTPESLNAADILLCVGTLEDSWLSELDDVKVHYASTGVELIENEWDINTIPINNMLVATYLTETLTKADSDHGGLYRQNLSDYVDVMIALDMRIRSAINKAVKIYCEDGSMAYFAKEYGVQIAANADNAVLLYTYTNPSAEDQKFSYVQLMEKNLDALNEGE